MITFGIISKPAITLPLNRDGRARRRGLRIAARTARRDDTRDGLLRLARLPLRTAVGALRRGGARHRCRENSRQAEQQHAQECKTTQHG